jgi:hypothetical protein
MMVFAGCAQLVGAVKAPEEEASHQKSKNTSSGKSAAVHEQPHGNAAVTLKQGDLSAN